MSDPNVEDACRQAREAAVAALEQVRVVALSHLATLRELLAPWGDTDVYLDLDLVVERLDARARAQAMATWQSDADVWAATPPPVDVPPAAESAREAFRLAQMVLVVASNFIDLDDMPASIPPADETHEGRVRIDRIVKLLRFAVGSAGDSPEGA
jgi:hypothetical protein